MMFRNFEEMAEAVKKNPTKCTLAVAAAADGAVIDAVLLAQNEGIIEPILVGNVEKIKSLLSERGKDPASYKIVDCEPGSEGQTAVDLVNEGKAGALMKGLMETKAFLGPIVKKENNLRTGSLITHLDFKAIPNYHKLVMFSDGGMVMYPSLEDKVAIIKNAVSVFHAIGYEDPKIGVLCAIEKVNPKMPETLDGQALQEMNERGEIPGCKVVGPISYDCAISKEIAQEKGFNCPYSGDFDCLIFPNIHAGNIVGKCLTVTAKAKMAGIVVGAKVPAIMTSRGSDASEKFNSIVLAALVSQGLAKDSEKGAEA
jgi:phosphate butyryltransferase